METLVALALSPVALPLGVYTLATFNLFFKFQEEGTASPVVKGESLHDIIGSWRGRYLNRPGYPGYKHDRPDHEVLVCDDPKNPPNPYNNPLLNVLAKRLGMYYMGPWPFVQTLWRTFEWTESKVENGRSVDWTRKEPTNFVYLKRFTYRFVLQAAEENTNKPVDLHFALTVECNNPRLAFFEITDWLTQLSVDAYDLARAFVGARSFEEIRSPKGQVAKTASEEFAVWMLKLNETLPSRTDKGAPQVYGITITDADLIEIALTGSNAVELARATQAVGIAQAHADAKVVTAKGDAESIKIVGNAQAEAIDATYAAVNRHKDGVAIRQAEAMERAAQGGATVVFGGSNAMPFINVPTPTRNGQMGSMPPATTSSGP